MPDKFFHYGVLWPRTRVFAAKESPKAMMACKGLSCSRSRQRAFIFGKPGSTRFQANRFRAIVWVVESFSFTFEAGQKKTKIPVKPATSYGCQVCRFWIFNLPP